MGHGISSFADRIKAVATAKPPAPEEVSISQDEVPISSDLEKRFRELTALVDNKGNPNINELWRIAKDIDLIKLNIKFFGYEIARQLAAALPPRQGLAPTHVGLKSKASTQSDLESDWAAYWASELKVPVVFHRKLWEFAYVLQALWEHGCMESGKRGLGFGCGIEPIPSYLASHDVAVTVTDLPPDDSAKTGWHDSNQYTATLEHAYKAELVDRDRFMKYVSLNYVDMNAIPATLRDYDFCWSICALEHIGSIKRGLAFIENSLNTLRVGGLAIHTTEYNYANDNATIDNWGTVLFQREHFNQLAERLRGSGHHVAPLDFSVGDKILDRFIDLPPYSHDMTPFQHTYWGGNNNHIKAACDGFAVTCFGLIIKKA